MAQSTVRVVDGNDVPVIFYQQGDVVTVAGRELVLVEYTFGRPANTTPYTAGDIIGPLTGSALVNVLVPPSGYIVGMALIDSINPALPLQAEVVIFDQGAPDPGADNAPWVADDNTMRHWVASVPLQGYYVGGATDASGQSTLYRVDNLNIAYVARADYLTLLLIARNAYVPASAGLFTLRMWIQRP